MANGISVGAEVTPEFNERIGRIEEEHDFNNRSETVRFLLREGADQVDSNPGFAQRLFKNLDIGLAMIALVGYMWATQVGYEQPIYVGVVWMIPAVAFLWLHELWPGIRARFGSSSADPVSPSEA